MLKTNVIIMSPNNTLSHSLRWQKFQKQFNPCIFCDKPSLFQYEEDAQAFEEDIDVASITIVNISCIKFPSSILKYLLIYMNFIPFHYHFDREYGQNEDMPQPMNNHASVTQELGDDIERNPSELRLWANLIRSNLGWIP